MAKELRHPQVPQEVVDLWLALPVTRAFLQCLEWRRLDTRDAAGDGTLVDSSNADLTHAVIHRALGQQDVYKELSDPVEILNYYDMIMEPEVNDDE